MGHSLEAFFKGKGCKGFPPSAAVGFVAEIVEVVHVGIGFHLEGVEQVAGVPEVLAVATGLKPVDEVAPVETKPRVVRGACLVEVYHLVVLDGVETGVHGLRLLLAVGDDVAEERQPVVALANPEGQGHGRHVLGAAGTDGPYQQGDNHEGMGLHSGCSV